MLLVIFRFGLKDHSHHTNAKTTSIRRLTWMMSLKTDMRNRFVEAKIAFHFRFSLLSVNDPLRLSMGHQ